MSLSKEIAKSLYEIKAIQIKPDRSFTWTSGIKSPIYCDNRLTMSFPDVRDKIADGFIELINNLDEKPDVIAGCATAGIPHAAWVAQKLDLPMVYVRSKPKAHGKGNQIEGTLLEGQKVVVIEDLISTGGSSINSALALREAGAEVLGVLAIFSYGILQAKANFENHQLPMETISNFDTLLKELVEVNQITNAEEADLLEWRNGLFASFSK
ncbi:orotate phosphoribosyltransferase [Aquibacillus koreensis]|uniref:Orotate phosphoribosyltransferase n=1 Tax=Aquibacillus koreensis TaxID=279446 RepID=A0A9X3WIE8_9BACI|nr:orotate phosphoribosyltransferase [Aquibacillus koreensis]MCT2538029.1 orotate phosphoribosyltransferase [Aquibacillus koreensis]MDC3420552.1 orotate phosphoribosyltransferase [Aquibacillus koreensis]